MEYYKGVYVPYNASTPYSVMGVFFENTTYALEYHIWANSTYEQLWTPFYRGDA